MQRAATRRRATAIDSDVWFDGLRERRVRSEPAAEVASAKPTGPLAESEVQAWLEVFSNPLEDETLHERVVDPTAASTEVSEIENPFPPGYADDLFEE